MAYMQQPQQAYMQQPQQAYMQQPQQMVLVDARYCLPQEVVLVMQENVGYKTDNFRVTDVNGTPWFNLDAKTFSMADKRTLLDAYNQPALQLERKMLTLHGTWLLTNPRTGQRVAEVKPSLMSLTPSIKVYLNDGDTKADFKIKGNFRAKKFDIIHYSPAGERVIASVKKESRFSSATAFMMSALTDADKYFVTISPGVDAAFIVALASLVDEVCHDQK